jgi:putative ABC transport system substrate-binding protein
MNRRDILKIVGLVSAWPAIGRAQSADMPVIGFLSSGSKADRQDQVDAFLRGLKEAGRKVGENLVIEYRWADDRDDHFQALALEIVRLKPAVIAVSSSTAIALSVKSATTTIPIVFCVGGDPVKNGLVASLNRPGGNLTGISYLSNALAPKRLELLRELTPKQTVIAHLVNPKNSNAKADVDEMVAAAHAVGLQIVLFEASNTRELDVSFLSMAQQKIGALIVASDTVFLSQRANVVTLSAQHKIAAIFDGQEYPHAGGLISYGANRPAAFRPAGVCVGRILNGATPAELPVEQPTTLELVVNLKAAKALGLTVPPTLVATADDVIE